MIFFECYPDESLLRFLGFTTDRLKGGHSFGKSNVSKKLQNATQSMGLIDEDPGRTQDPYLRYLLSLNPVYSDQYLGCFMDVSRSNKLVVLKPDLEGFTLRLAKDLKIDLINYSLSNNVNDLHDILTLRRNYQKREKFIQFFADNANHWVLLKLKEIVK